MRVLFVCVGNSCRSQMAEGFARSISIEAASAGTEPASFGVAPLAVEVMAEVGIDISGHDSKSIDDFSADDWDLVISMGCGVSCPNVRIDQDWELKDPFHTGIIEEYRACRDEIENRVKGLLE